MGMSALSRFMSTARHILDQNDREASPPRKEQPPVFIRTTWLYVEIDEGIERAKTLSQQIKIARLNSDTAEVRRLTNQIIRTVTQVAEICNWADEQFQRENQP
jgi:hypothetical protein